jgi:broad specificity phosphatase PhoE
VKGSGYRHNERMGDIVVVRHGQTEWSANGRHTSTTDLDLTQTGEAAARALSRVMVHRSFVAVVSSPRRRARRTAELAGLLVTEIDADVAEWDYGKYEGLTTAQIRAERPGWNLWTDGCPDGEAPDRVTDRLDRFLAKLRPMLVLGDVVVISHGHAARALAARWLAQPIAFGAHLTLDTATVSVLGHEHDAPSLRSWNAPVG